MECEDSKTLEQLYREGKITKEKIKSLALLAQTGMFFSSSPEDAIFIAKQVERLKSGKDIEI